jgi:ABC-2 type transport system ATP-binding protein
LFSTHILSDVERICTDVAFLSDGVVQIQGKLSDVKRKYEGDEYILEAEREEDLALVISEFPQMQAIGQNQLKFSKSSCNAFQVMRFIADKEINISKIERLEPTLESLFVEVAK